MTRIDHIGVVVPAADEQDTLGRCLAALADAVTQLTTVRPEVSVDLIVVLDGCRDASADIVATVPGCYAMTTDARSVGHARAGGSRAALHRAPVPSTRVWTAHTDADSTVPGHWLLAHLRYAQSGAGIVLGTVAPDLQGPSLSRWRSIYADEHGHPHVHGANLGVRGDVLERLGGWPLLRTAEDVALVARAALLGVPVASVGGLAVRTSGRRVARAPSGFSRYLRDLDRSAHPLTRTPAPRAG